MEESKKQKKWLLIAHMGAGSAPKDPKKVLRIEEMLKLQLKNFSKNRDLTRKEFLEFMTKIEVLTLTIIFRTQD